MIASFFCAKWQNLLDTRTLEEGRCPVCLFRYRNEDLTGEQMYMALGRSFFVYLKKAVKALYGLFLYLRLSPSYKYILMSVGIGDIVWFCAYYNGFIQTYHTPDLKLIVTNKKADLLDFFDIEKENVICISEFGNQCLDIVARCHFFHKIVSGQIDDRDIYVHQAVKKFVREKNRFDELAQVQFQRIGIEMDQLYKYGYFNLSCTAEVRKAAVSQTVENEAVNYMENNGYSFEYILVVPYANTRVNIPDIILKEIIKAVRGKGFHVLINSDNKNLSVDEKCFAILPPLRYMPVIAQRAEMVISARCGLADFLYLTGCRLLIVHYIESDDLDAYQNIAARVESFYSINERCRISEQSLINDFYMFNDIDHLTGSIEELLKQLSKMLR